MIYAGLDGIQQKLPLPAPTDLNLFTASADILALLQRLPLTLREAATLAANSSFVSKYLPKTIVQTYYDQR